MQVGQVAKKPNRKENSSLAQLVILSCLDLKVVIGDLVAGVGSLAETVLVMFKLGD